MPESPLDMARVWVEFTDPGNPQQRFRCDLTWLTSRWTCVFGNGCKGILPGRPHDGCCSLGAHFTEKADYRTIRDVAEQLTPQEWQFYGLAHEGARVTPVAAIDPATAEGAPSVDVEFIPEPLSTSAPIQAPAAEPPIHHVVLGGLSEGYELPARHTVAVAGVELVVEAAPAEATQPVTGAATEPATEPAAEPVTEPSTRLRRSAWTELEDGVRKTRVVKGACIFLNRPGFAGGAGCALHQHAIRQGIPTHQAKPEVCWQLPIRRTYRTVEEHDGSSYLETTITEYDRRAWGPGGHDLAWYCSGNSAAHIGREPVFRSCRSELVELMGEAAYDELVVRCTAHLRSVKAAHRGSGRAMLPLLVHPATLEAEATPRSKRRL